MDIVKLLKNGESDTVEFKSGFNKEAVISLAAFANTKGGKVIVGADNKEACKRYQDRPGNRAALSERNQGFHLSTNIAQC